MTIEACAIVQMNFMQCLFDLKGPSRSDWPWFLSKGRTLLVIALISISGLEVVLIGVAVYLTSL